MNKSFYLLILILFCSCHKEVRFKSYQCQTDRSIQMYPDSSFFSKINCMQYCRGKLYLLDKKRGDVVWVDEDLSRMGGVAQHGVAPDELVMPLEFMTLNDTIYVLDFGSKSMKIFYGGKMIDRFTPLNANENRFAVDEHTLYISATTDSSCYLKILKNDESVQISQGKVKMENTIKRTIMLNCKHVFYSKGFIYTVSGNFPFIEKYNATTGQLIDTYDLSDVELIRNSMEYGEALPYNPNSYYIFIADAYLHSNSLYLLCSSRNSGKDYKVKTILRIDLRDEMKAACSYILPHDIYSSFCISDSFIYAFRDDEVCEIEKILYPDASI